MKLMVSAYIAQSMYTLFNIYISHTRNDQFAYFKMQSFVFLLKEKSFKTLINKNIKGIFIQRMSFSISNLNSLLHKKMFDDK